MTTVLDANVHNLSVRLVPKVDGPGAKIFYRWKDPLMTASMLFPLHGSLGITS